MLTIVGGVVMILLGLESGGELHPWSSAFVLCLTIFGAVAVFLFVLNEWKLAEHPLIPPRLFRAKSNIGAYGVVFIHGMIFASGNYYLPLYFQKVLGASALLSGVYLLPSVLSLSFATLFSGAFVRKTGRFRELIYIGVLFMSLGYGLLIDLGPTKNLPKLIIYQLIVGFGSGLNIQSPLIALQSHTKGYDVAVATSTYGFIRTLATSVSIVVGGTISQTELVRQGAVLRQALGLDIAERIIGEGFGTNPETLQHLSPQQRDTINEVYTSSLRTMWIFYAALSACAFLPALLIQKAELSDQHKVVKTGVEELKRIRLIELQEKEEKKKARNGGTRAGNFSSA